MAERSYPLSHVRIISPDEIGNAVARDIREAPSLRKRASETVGSASVRPSSNDVFAPESVPVTTHVYAIDHRLDDEI